MTQTLLSNPLAGNADAELEAAVADEDVYICPAGERLTYRYTNEENVALPGSLMTLWWRKADSNFWSLHERGPVARLCSPERYSIEP